MTGECQVPAEYVTACEPEAKKARIRLQSGGLSCVEILCPGATVVVDLDGATTTIWTYLDWSNPRGEKVWEVYGCRSRTGTSRTR